MLKQTLSVAHFLTIIGWILQDKSYLWRRDCAYIYYLCVVDICTEVMVCKRRLASNIDHHVSGVFSFNTGKLSLIAFQTETLTIYMTSDLHPKGTELQKVKVKVTAETDTQIHRGDCITSHAKLVGS